MTAARTEMEILRESQDRALHREGIPMFVALRDERGGSAIPVVDAPAKGAAALVARLEHYRSVLARGQRVDDMGVLISILTVTAYEDFDRNVSA